MRVLAKLLLGRNLQVELELKLVINSDWTVEVEAGEADLQGSFMAFRVTFSRSINTIVRGSRRIECNVKTITCG
jgi:hypothetical protein